MTGSNGAAAILTLAGFVVVFLGWERNHPVLPNWLGGGSSLSFIDQQVGPKEGNYYLNSGELALFVIGAALLALHKKTAHPRGFLAVGLLFLAIGASDLLFGFPSG